MNLPINQIIQSDALLGLKKLPDETIDLVITSPPYLTLNFGYDNMVEWKEIKKDNLLKENTILVKPNLKKENIGVHQNHFGKKNGLIENMLKKIKALAKLLINSISPKRLYFFGSENIKLNGVQCPKLERKNTGDFREKLMECMELQEAKVQIGEAEAHLKDKPLTQSLRGKNSLKVFLKEIIINAKNVGSDILKAINLWFIILRDGLNILICGLNQQIY